MKIILIAGVYALVMALGYLMTTGLVWIGVQGYEIGFNAEADWNIWGLGLSVFVILLLFGGTMKQK